MFIEELQSIQNDYGEMAQDMLGTFSEELSERCESLKTNLDLADSWTDDLMSLTLRELHTLKGIAGQVSLNSISKMVHRIEDHLIEKRQKDGTPSIEVIYSLSDFISQLSFLPNIISNLKNIPSNTKEIIAELELREKKIFEAKPQDSKQTPTPAASASSNSREVISEKSFNLNVSDFKKLSSNLQKISRYFSESGPNNLNNDAQESLFTLISARTQPGSKLEGRMKKLFRETCKSVGKDAKLEIKGFRQDIDRDILQAISEALTHMVRNSLDHGIENTEERAKVGKESLGIIVIEIRQLSDRTILSIADDGRGLDGDKIAQSALKKGIIDINKLNSMTYYEKQELIFAPGFSTSDQASMVSGRGVGMDAVATRIKELSGKLTLESEVGKGTKFYMEFPAPFQLTPVCLFKIQNQTLGISAKSVTGLFVNLDRITREFGSVEIEGFEEPFMEIELRGIGKSVADPCGYLVMEINGTKVALAIETYLGCARFSFNLIESHPGLAKCVGGLTDNANFGAILLVDTTEIERHLNEYFVSDDEDEQSEVIDSNTITKIIETSPNPQEREALPMQLPQISGNGLTKEQVIQTLDSDELGNMLFNIIAPLQTEGPEHLPAIQQFAIRCIEDFKSALEPIDDEEELQYLMAIRYATLKSEWILLNSHLQYTAVSGKKEDIKYMYRAAILSTLIRAIEPLASREAISNVSQVLAEPMPNAA